MTKIQEVLEAIRKITGKTNPVDIYKFVEKLSMAAREESQIEVKARKAKK